MREESPGKTCGGWESASGYCGWEDALLVALGIVVVGEQVWENGCHPCWKDSMGLEQRVSS